MNSPISTRLALFLSLCMAGTIAYGTPRPATPQPAQGHYVAMGSSFAAGPGIQPATNNGGKCGRSHNNYAAQLARHQNLALDDVSCGGATSHALLTPWGDIPAQIDAVRPDTQLVTVTIGGNDIGYVGSLFAAACLQPGIADKVQASGHNCPKLEPAQASAYQQLETNLRTLVARIVERAPLARVVFVDYLTILPPDTPCSVTPLTSAQASEIRDRAEKLAALTAKVARETGTDLLEASSLSSDHHACAAEPWMIGYPVSDTEITDVPYHPNLAGMTAVARALSALLAAPEAGQDHSKH